jgi:hypothetical protein
MTRPRPRLSQIPLWERHVELVLAVARDALIRLAEQSVHGDEPALNRAFYECAMLANRDRHDRGQAYLESLLIWEARNQPSPATSGTTAENKIPDFQCGYTDHACPDPLSAVRMFVIECKRLGTPTATGWNFNSRYVSDGVLRFVDARWQYGKHVESGAMIGYLDGMSAPAVLAEVNTAATNHGVPLLVMGSGSVSPLHELRHSLGRSFAESPFELVHLWVENPSPPSTAAVSVARQSALKSSKKAPGDRASRTQA